VFIEAVALRFAMFRWLYKAIFSAFEATWVALFGQIAQFWHNEAMIHA